MCNMQRSSRNAAASVVIMLSNYLVKIFYSPISKLFVIFSIHFIANVSKRLKNSQVKNHVQCVAKKSTKLVLSLMRLNIINIFQLQSLIF